MNAFPSVGLLVFNHHHKPERAISDTEPAEVYFAARGIFSFAEWVGS